MFASAFTGICCLAQTKRYYVEKYNNKTIEVDGESVAKLYKGNIPFSDETEIKLSYHENLAEDSLRIKGPNSSILLRFSSLKELKRNAGELDGNNKVSCTIKQYRTWRKQCNHSRSGHRRGGGKFNMGTSNNNEESLITWSEVYENEVLNNYDEDRWALIIGNSYYDSCVSLKSVPACVKSANIVAGELRKIGFHTIVLYNAERDSILSALDFLTNVKGENGRTIIRLFYYVGHGMRNGNDYIIPVDATSKNDITQCINISAIADSLDKNCNGFNLLFIDACRNGDSMTKHSGEEYQNLKNTLVICSTNNGNAAFADSTTTDFTLPFVNHIKDQNSMIQTVYNSIRDEVLNQNTTLYPNSERRITKKKINHEKMGLWAGLGMKAQVPVKSDLPTAWVPYATFGVNNIYVWRCKTQIKIDLGWNVCKKTTSPVYLYDGNIVTYASEFRNTWDVSCRYGPSFDLTRSCSLSAMAGISYHYLHGTRINGMNIDAASTYCFTPTLDCELSYRFCKYCKLSFLLGTDFLRISHDHYKPLKQIPFMDNWYQPNVNISVGLSLLL